MNDHSRNPLIPCLPFAMAVMLAVPSGSRAEDPVGREPHVSATFQMQPAPVLLGDVAFAEVRFTNHGEQPVYLQPPSRGRNYSIRRAGSERESRGQSERLDLFGPYACEFSHLGRRKVDANESLSTVCLVKMLGRFSQENYPKVDSIQADYQLVLPVEFRAATEYSEKEGRLNPHILLEERRRVYHLFRGQSVSLRVDGLALATYADTVRVYGVGTIGIAMREQEPLISEESFPWEVKQWSPIRAKIHPRSNLERLLRYSEEYQRIIQSEMTEEQKFVAVMKLRDKSRPLEYRWLTSMFRRALSGDLSDKVYQRMVR